MISEALRILDIEEKPSTGPQASNCTRIEEDLKRKAWHYSVFQNRQERSTSFSFPIPSPRGTNDVVPFPIELVLSATASAWSSYCFSEIENPTACVIFAGTSRLSEQYIPSMLDLATVASEMFVGIREATETELRNLNDFFDESLTEEFWQ